MDIRLPKYYLNQDVKAITDLLNDGTHPEKNKDELLVKEGTRGIIVQTGIQDERIPVYMVDFENGMVVGVYEEEIEALT